MHEILHTTFRNMHGMTMPVQVISNFKIPWDNDLDLSHLDAQEQQAQIAEQFQRIGRRPFGVEEWPLFLALVTLSSASHLLFIHVSALCADRESLQILMAQVVQAYSTRLNGDRYFTQAMQYADFSAWQNELILSKNTDKKATFWDNKKWLPFLQTAVSFEKKVPKQAKFRPHLLTWTIKAERMSEIRALAEKYDVAISSCLLACWQILLSQLEGQSEIVVNTAFQGRCYKELTESIGLFTKYLPLHSSIRKHKRFNELLVHVEQMTEEVYECQEYFNPEEMVRKNSGTTHSPSHFPFCFDFLEPEDPCTTNNISFALDTSYACLSRFKINLSCRCEGDALKATFYFDSELFGQQNMQRLAEVFQTLIARVLVHPDSVIGRLSMLTDTQKRQLLVEFNKRDTNYSKERCFHILFAEQAARTPEKIAVEWESQFWTYGELNTRANQLAHYLRKQGVGPESLVAICIDRSLEMLVGLLGILKAGGAYVPFDPTYPQERLAFMLKDTGASVLLTQRSIKVNFSILALEFFQTYSQHATVICLDSDWQKIAKESDENALENVVPQHLAYVMYTSGSTGMPNSVMVSHQSLVNYLTWCAEAYALSQGQGVLVHSPLVSDLILTSLFAPLLVGQKLILLPEKNGMDALCTALQSRTNISLFKVTPVHLEALNRLLETEKTVQEIKSLVVGGDALQAESLSLWRTHKGGPRIINEYGPTETVVGCCVHEVSPETPESGPVPIGRPIANTQLYLLNHYLEPVPPWLSRRAICRR